MAASTWTWCERAQPPVPPESQLAARFAAMRSVRYALTGQLTETVDEALAARAIQERTLLTDEWVAAALPTVLLRVYAWLEDYEAVEREAAAALAAPELPEPVKLVLVPGAQALAWFEAGHLAQAAEAARAADAQARRLGFGQHFFAVDYLRALAGLALERRDLDTAEQLTEQALSISEHGRPSFEFLALLDRAADLGRPRAGPRCAGDRRGGPRWSWPGPGRCCWRGPMSWRRCCACRSATCAPPASWPAGCPPPAAACCWPGSRSPPAITTPRKNTCRHRRWPT